MLQRIVERKPQDKVRFSAVFDAPPEEVLSSACRLGLEGVIAKRRDSAYVPRRSSDWIKLKCGQRQEFVIGGYTDPKGSRTGIGSLLLGVHGEDGSLRYAGNVGTGFNEQALRELRDKLDALHADASPFAADAEIPKKAHWVRPELICEVSFGEWTRSGRVRHSVFQGLRSDKPPVAITRETPRHDAPVDKLARARRSSPPARRASRPTPQRPPAESSGRCGRGRAAVHAARDPSGAGDRRLQRHHQDRPGALLREGGAADDGAPEGPAGGAGARALGHRRRTVLPEARRALPDAGGGAARSRRSIRIIRHCWKWRRPRDCCRRPR